MPESPVDIFAQFEGGEEVRKFVDEVGAALSELGTNLLLADIFAAVTAEFWRARELHGDQTDRPLGTGPDKGYVNELDDYLDDMRVERGPASEKHHGLDNVTVANAARVLCQQASSTAEGDTWAKIVGEEFFELLAEDDLEKVATEAVQTIAMLVNLILAARKAALAAA